MRRREKTKETKKGTIWKGRGSGERGIYKPRDIRIIMEPNIPLSIINAQK